MFSKQFNRCKSNTLFHCIGSNLDIYRKVQYWLKEHFLWKKGSLFWKKGPQKFHPRSYSIPILSVLHENKAYFSPKESAFNCGTQCRSSEKVAINGLTGSWYIAHPEFLQNFNYPRLALLIKNYYTCFRTAHWSWRLSQWALGDETTHQPFFSVFVKEIFLTLYFSPLRLIPLW